MTKIVDTSVVVEVDRRGVDDRVARLDDEGRHAVSVVTLTELRLGVDRLYDPDTDVRAEAREALDRLLARFDVLHITRATAATAANVVDELRRDGRPLDDLHDVYIGATARNEQLPRAHGERRSLRAYRGRPRRGLRGVLSVRSDGRSGPRRRPDQSGSPQSSIGSAVTEPSASTTTS